MGGRGRVAREGTERRDEGATAIQGSAVAQQPPPSTDLQGDPMIPVFQVRTLTAREVGAVGTG